MLQKKSEIFPKVGRWFGRVPTRGLCLDRRGPESLDFLEKNVAARFKKKIRGAYGGA